MSNQEHDPADRLVDMLLCELVGNEAPPDVSRRVLDAVGKSPRASKARKKISRKQARPRPARPSILPALLTASVFIVLLVAAGGFYYGKVLPAARTPLLSEIKGTINRTAGPVQPGETLETGKDSGAVLIYRDGTKVELGADTTLIVTRGDRWTRAKEIEIVSGKITAQVTSQPEGSPMSLRSADAIVEVVGTEFLFQCQDGVSRLEVTQGVVRFVPRSGGAGVLVEPGLFAESGAEGFRSGKIKAPPVPGITRFTLMNAAADQPMRDVALADGETISLASLPTREINIRADYEGKPPSSVKITVTRSDDGPTGLPPYVARAQQYPPFFVAGDYWAEGRPDDCRSWTPGPGTYHISAIAVYAEGGKNFSKERKMELRITE